MPGHQNYLKNVVFDTLAPIKLWLCDIFQLSLFLKFVRLLNDSAVFFSPDLSGTVAVRRATLLDNTRIQILDKNKRGTILKGVGGMGEATK